MYIFLLKMKQREKYIQLEIFATFLYHQYSKNLENSMSRRKLKFNLIFLWNNSIDVC